MRLNKYIAHSGLCSRRKADELISRGQVQVNGEVVSEMGLQVQEGDLVEVRGKRISPEQEILIVALHKPGGYTSTMADWHKDEQPVTVLLDKQLPRLNPVGRLDKDSTGLLLLTNDGQLAHELTHPSFEHEKEYQVTTQRRLSDADLQQLAEGITLEEGMTKPAHVERITDTSFSIVLQQGWKRQIRRMVAALDHRVTRLHRVRIGKLELGTIKEGTYRIVQKEDIV